MNSKVPRCREGMHNGETYRHAVALWSQQAAPRPAPVAIYTPRETNAHRGRPLELFYTELWPLLNLFKIY